MTTVQSFLIIGSGGREHALCWRLRHEGYTVHAAPGSDGIAADAQCHAVTVDDHAEVVALAERLGVDAVVVGPEQPLVDGLADHLRQHGVAVVGPGARAAALEGSKAVAKAFMTRHGIPTARHETVDTVGEAIAALSRFETPPVVKADGLAAGKGVTVPESFAEAEAAVRRAMQDKAFGAAGSRIVLEQRLRGQEASLFVLTDGETFVELMPAQDHKRIGDGDTGPNTGGMGAYAPAPIVDEAVRAKVIETIVAPTIGGLARDGEPYRGVLFVGLMIDDGDPHVIEYNCRFGDPEIQPLMFGLRDAIGPHLLAAATGGLRSARLMGAPAATVVLASAGYPQGSSKGDVITGVDAAAGRPDTMVFHAGTRRDGAGRWLTAGGRVLGVCARGDDLAQAVARAYEGMALIAVPGGQYRRDIGARAKDR